MYLNVLDTWDSGSPEKLVPKWFLLLFFFSCFFFPVFLNFLLTSRASPTTPSDAPTVDCCQRPRWRQDNAETKSVSVFYTAAWRITKDQASLTEQGHPLSALHIFPLYFTVAAASSAAPATSVHKIQYFCIYSSVIAIYSNSFHWSFSSPFTGLKYKTNMTDCKIILARGVYNLQKVHIFQLGYFLCQGYIYR